MFVLYFAIWCVFAKMKTSYAIHDALLNERDTDELLAFAPEDTFSQASDTLFQDSDTLFQDSDSLFQDSDSLFQDSDSLIQNSDPVFSSDSIDIALQPLDQASATTCDETQSSLNLFLDSPPSSLNARDLADELPGFQDFVAPLSQIKDSTCAAPKVPKGSQGGGGGGGGRNPQNLDSPAQFRLEEKIRYGVSTDGYCYFMDDDFVSVLYPIALCCDGGTNRPLETFQAFVQGCTPCKFSREHPGSSVQMNAQCTVQYSTVQ